MRLASLMIAFCFLLTPVIASAEWEDSFDTYPTGSGLHGQGGWHGWDGNPAWDAYVSDLYSLSSPNSVEIVGASDMVHEFTEDTDSWIFTAWQYIPTGFAGQSYFLLLNTYNDGGPYNWSSQVSFNSSTGLVLSDGDNGTLPMVTGRWVELRIEIDLDLDVQIFYYDGQLLYQKSWREGMSGGGAQYFGAVDLYANNASPIYYDDLSLVLSGPTATEATSWGKIRGLFR